MDLLLDQTQRLAEEMVDHLFTYKPVDNLPVPPMRYCLIAIEDAQLCLNHIASICGYLDATLADTIQNYFIHPKGKRTKQIKFGYLDLHGSKMNEDALDYIWRTTGVYHMVSHGNHILVWGAHYNVISALNRVRGYNKNII
jgi:hypothetical protein